MITSVRNPAEIHDGVLYREAIKQVLLKTRKMLDSTMRRCDRQGEYYYFARYEGAAKTPQQVKIQIVNFTDAQGGRQRGRRRREMEMVNDGNGSRKPGSWPGSWCGSTAPIPRAYEKEIGEFVYGWLRGRILEAGAGGRTEQDEAGWGRKAVRALCGGEARNCKGADEAGRGRRGRPGAEGRASQGAVAGLRTGKPAKFCSCRREACTRTLQRDGPDSGEARPGFDLYLPHGHHDAGGRLGRSAPGAGAVPENGRLYGREPAT